MMKFNKDDVKKALIAKGFALRNFLNPITEPLIAQHHVNTRSRIYPPETVVLMMMNSVLSGQDSLMEAVIKNNADRIMQNLDPASANTAAYSNARSRVEAEIFVEAGKFNL